MGIFLNNSDILQLIKNDPITSIKEEDIKFAKLYSDLRYKANEMGVLSECIVCKKNITGKANSHSVPQSILKNIETDGHFYQPTCAINNGLVFGPFGRINSFGLNNAGTFHLLCSDCENKLFKDYEDANFLSNVAENNESLLTNKILAEIMLKTCLRERYKKEFDKNMFLLMDDIILNTKNRNPLVLRPISTKADELNISEYDDYIHKCLDVINKIKDINFKVFFFKILDHASSIAAQALVSIQRTVTNIVINDVFNYDKNYKIVSANFVVFPLKNKTILFAFCFEDDYQRIKPFDDYLKSLNETSQLKLFQSTLFLSSEEVYLNKENINNLIEDKISMSFIEAGMDNALTTAEMLNNNELLDAPDLTAPNNFRKAKLIL